MSVIAKTILTCAVGIMMISISSAQDSRYAFNIWGGYSFLNKAKFNNQPRQLTGTPQGGLSLEIFTGPFNSVEVLYQLDISTPMYRHFNVPVRDKKEGVRMAYIMVNEVFHVPIKEKLEWWIALGPGLGLACIDDAAVLEGIAWDVRTGLKKNLNSWLSAKIQTQVFSSYYQEDGTANTGSQVSGVNFVIYQFGVTAGLCLKL